MNKRNILLIIVCILFSACNVTSENLQNNELTFTSVHQFVDDSIKFLEMERSIDDTFQYVETNPIFDDQAKTMPRINIHDTGDGYILYSLQNGNSITFDFINKQVQGIYISVESNNDSTLGELINEYGSPSYITVIKWPSKDLFSKTTYESFAYLEGGVFFDSIVSKGKKDGNPILTEHDKVSGLYICSLNQVQEIYQRKIHSYDPSIEKKKISFSQNEESFIQNWQGFGFIGKLYPNYILMTYK